MKFIYLVSFPLINVYGYDHEEWMQD